MKINLIQFLHKQISGPFVPMESLSERSESLRRMEGNELEKNLSTHSLNSLRSFESSIEANGVRKCLRFIFLKIVIAFPIAALANDQELFLHANQQYQQQQYDAALSEYAAIKDKNSCIWYNMGNCAFKKNEYARALLYWKRAQKKSSGPLYDRCATNAALATQKLCLNNPLCSWRMRTLQYFDTLLIKIPMLALQILFFCLFGVFLVISWRFLKQKKYIHLIASFVIIMLCTMSVYRVYSIDTRTNAIVMEPKAGLLVGPDTHYRCINTVPAGACVTVLEERKEWIKIATEQEIGWMMRTTLETI